MLADQITSLRKRAGLSQCQLAEVLSIGPSAVGMYEQGRRTPSIEMLIRMAALFDVSLDYLLTGRETTCQPITGQDPASHPPCPCKRCCPYQQSFSVCIDRRNENK